LFSITPGLQEQVVRKALVLCVVAAWTSPGTAAIRPSFDEGANAWHATHAVIVDGTGKVLESWKGGLKVGYQFDLKKLGVPKEPEVRNFFGPPRVVRKASGERVLLYLIKEGRDWKPAARFGGMPVSAVWFERGQAFAFVQKLNPGPSLLVKLDRTEPALKALTLDYARVQQKLRKVVASADPTKRAREMLPFIDDTAHYGVAAEAWKVIEDCKSGALPFLRTLLKDEGRFLQHGTVIDTMYRAGGKEAIPDLEAVLADELAYWKATGPGLDRTWWGEQPMTRHYGKVISALRGLKAVGYTDGGRKVRAFRDYWQSLPQLDYVGKGDLPGSRSQVVEEADAVIGR
jgi:hypothetical protein